MATCRRRWITRRCLNSCLLFAGLGAVCSLVVADEPMPAGTDHKPTLTERRFEVMQRRLASAKIRSEEPGFPTQLSAKPIFRYHDPARDVLVAGVWKLGDEGRPRAMLAAELYRINQGKPSISCEYSSMTATPFTLTSEDMHWTPSSTLYQFRDLPKSPAPAEAKLRRSLQLREMAKRFAAYEIVSNERCELRLLPQPVDRYTPSQTERADGAIFFFTFGTNPEVVLLIESDDGLKWRYAAGRMTGAEVVVVTLDSVKAWEGAPLEKGTQSSFTGSVTAIDVPGIADDGSELSE